MTETIPNPSVDKGFQEEGRLFVDNLMKAPHTGFDRLSEFDTAMRQILNKAYMRGLQNGFRYGWKIHESRAKSQRCPPGRKG